MNVLYVTSTARSNLVMRILCAASGHALTSVAHHQFAQLPGRDERAFDVVLVDSKGWSSEGMHRAWVDLIPHISPSTPILEINRSTVDLAAKKLQSFWSQTLTRN